MKAIQTRRREGGFTLIELLIVVAIMGILAAVIVPNLGRVLSKGSEEADKSEKAQVQLAVNAMITDNRLSSLPAPVGSLTIGTPNTCVGAVNTMSAFPDSTSSAAVPASAPGKVTDPEGNAYTYGSDKTGYILFGHDIKGNNTLDTTLLVNYVNKSTTKKWYVVEPSGTVHQCTAAGTSAELNP